MHGARPSFSRDRGRRRAGQRDCRPRARLRRHVLRVSGTPQRAARRRGAGRRRNCRRFGPRAPRRLCRWLRDRGAAGTRDEPAALSARLALHLHAWHDRRRCRGRAADWPRRRGLRPCPRHRGVRSVRFERELRHDGEAAARRAGRAQRCARRAAGSSGNDSKRGGDRGAAGISGGHGQRAPVARRRGRRSLYRFRRGQPSRWPRGSSGSRSEGWAARFISAIAFRSPSSFEALPASPRKSTSMPKCGCTRRPTIITFRIRTQNRISASAPRARRIGTR